METISIFDGLVLTVVSILVVFLLLTAIWGLVELFAKLLNRQETATETVNLHPMSNKLSTFPDENSQALVANPKYQQVAEIIALVLASENQPDKKFEITDSKRVK